MRGPRPSCRPEFPATFLAQAEKIARQRTGSYRGSAKNCVKFQVTIEERRNSSRRATSRTLILAAVIARFFKVLCGFSPPLEGAAKGVQQVHFWHW